MLVHSKSQKIVLNLSDPQRVLTVIPTAKMFKYKHHNLVAVPHRMDETRLLRNLGINAPSPIKHYYKWSGQHAPFMAQRETAGFLTLNPYSFCLSEMGTGKTLAILWAYDYLRSLGYVRKLLVIAPLSALERTWADEVFEHFPHLNFAVLYGTKDRRLKMLQSDADIYIVNHDGIKVIEQALIAKTDLDVVAVDEIASFRNASTGRWKCLRKVITGRKIVWGVTGTPTPNDPTDAWAQCRLICPENVSPYYGKWRETVMRQLTQFKWVPRDNAVEMVFEAMQPAIRFERKDCVDLPPCIYQERNVTLSPEQKKGYADMLAKLAMEYQGGLVTAVNEAVKMAKLVQIACGVVYGADGTVYLPSLDRISVVREVVEQAGTKVIVFCPFKGVVEFVAKKLSEDFSVAVITGDVPKRARDEIFADFQQSADPRVLVASPGAMQHSLTLTAANTIVWYAPITSNDIFGQANARITRPGQKHTQFIVLVEGTEVERKMYARLKSRQKMQGLLLDAVRER